MGGVRSAQEERQDVSRSAKVIGRSPANPGQRGSPVERKSGRCGRSPGRIRFSMFHTTSGYQQQVNDDQDDQ